MFVPKRTFDIIEGLGSVRVFAKTCRVIRIPSDICVVPEPSKLNVLSLDPIAQQQFGLEETTIK